MKIVQTEKPVKKPVLRPTLSLFDATAISVGAIIGAGIFVVTGTVAGLAGSALIISVLIAGLVAFVTALSMGRISRKFPEEGGIYICVCEVVSPFVGFVTGWIWLVAHIFSGAAVALGFAHYLESFLPFIPAKLTAVILCLAFAELNVTGMRFFSRINNALVIAKVAVLLFFIIFGFTRTSAANLIPFNPVAPGVFIGAYFMFFAFGGFARVAVVAGEIKDAPKNVPRAIMISLAVSAAIYILVGFVAVGLAGAPGLADSASPLASAMTVTGNVAATSLISAGAMVATATVLLTAIMGASRMAYAMAGRGEFPSALQKLHPKYQTPYFGIWIIAILMSIMVLLVDVTRVVAMSTFATLFYYILANFSVVRMRTAGPLRLHILPVLGILSCLALLVMVLFVRAEAWIAGGASLVVGIIYGLLRRRYFRNEF